MVRTSIGRFGLEEAKNLNQILNESDSEKYIIPPEIAWDLIQR